MLSFTVAESARIAPERFVCKKPEPLFRAAALLFCLAAAQPAFAQSPAPAAAGANSQPPAPAQPIPPVTTTVVVHGQTEDSYLPETVTVGTLDGAPLAETPLSATVVTRELLNDQDARLLSDVVKNDASIDDDYVPVGYYGDYEIRGFPDRSGYRPRDQRHDHRRRAGCSSRKQGARGVSERHCRRGERRGFGGRADRFRNQATGGDQSR